MENDTTSKSCINCGSSLNGKFCHQCGQKNITAEDKTLKHFLEEVISSLFFADGKLLKTFKTLLFVPGQLSQEYIKGVRKKYINPIPLFLFVNLIYFLFPLTSTFNTSLRTQMSSFSYSKVIKVSIEEEVYASGESFEIFENRYNKQSNSNAKLLLIVLVLLQAIWLKLLFLKKKGIYFVDFFGASAYFNSFYIFTLLICLPLLAGLVSRFTQMDFFLAMGDNDSIISLVFLVLVLFYTFLFLKKAFNLRVVEALLKGGAMVLFIVPSFLIYRFILFWVTFWMIT